MAGNSVGVNTKWCKSCGICVAYCPKKVFALTEKKKLIIDKEDECVACKMCEYRCPDLAITITGKENQANG
ncbi:4Fe-4S dicluster domain-containing protein [Sporomusa termitida]|uniref:NAD(P)H-quinone oxidoreductase subunit I, chloroplastic n=1 Tax=Sporomusa termitida TaxID=2377 RepID=A0A517DW46_9FIRM|nr:4Fe-4S binding protein [Sporomusa termitida]QDR81543.1 NAD(P)H-quinone oxidoreductase subunit I, chloroplastic [Sporomusa termitida]